MFGGGTGGLVRHDGLLSIHGLGKGVRIVAFRFAKGVSRRCFLLSPSTVRLLKPKLRKSNPTRAGPCPSGNPGSNSPFGEVRSQRQAPTAAGAGARPG